MRVRHRRPPDPGRPAPVVADAREQALWDAQSRPRSRRRLAAAMIALGVVVVLVLGSLVVARARPHGDILALGSTTASTALPPLGDRGSSSAGGEGDLSGATPGDTLPGGGPAAADPAAVGGGGPGAAAAPGAAGSGAPGGALAGAGPGAGAGVPVPTSGPGGSTGSTGTPSTTAPPGGGGTTPTAPPTPPTAAPPGLPTCSIGSVAASPNPVRKKGNGQLRNDVVVTFQGNGCGTPTFQVTVNGHTVTAAGTGGGGWSATIVKGTSGWSAGTFPITITGGGAVASVVLEVTS